MNIYPYDPKDSKSKTHLSTIEDYTADVSRDELTY